MPINYWDHQYQVNDKAHSTQNCAIAQDFLRHAPPQMWADIRNARTILEIGCGTGEFLHWLETDATLLLGVDSCQYAIDIANRNQTAKIQYKTFDILNEPAWKLGTFDLGLCSNVLEHFTDPDKVINNILAICDKVILIVPLEQSRKDGFDEEGGAGHVFSFDRKFFDKYHVMSEVTFHTNGWQCTESEYQLAVELWR